MEDVEAAARFVPVRVPGQSQQRSRVPAFGGWVLVWLVLGANVGGNLPSAGAGSSSREAGYLLGLMVLAPFIAAWAAARFGPRVIGPTLLLTLVPSFGFQLMPELTFGMYGVSIDIAVMGIIAGAWWVSRDNPAPWKSLIRLGHAWRLVPAMTLLWIGEHEWPASVRFFGNNFTLALEFSLAGLLGSLVLVSVVDWKAPRTNAGSDTDSGSQHRFRYFVLPALLVVASTLGLTVRAGPVTVYWGAVYEFGWVPVIGLILLLTGAYSGKAWWLALGVGVSLEMLRTALGLPNVAHWVRGPEAFDMSGGWREVAVQACSVLSGMLLGYSLRSTLGRNTAQSRRHINWLLGCALLLPFAIAASLTILGGNQSTFRSLDVIGWLAAGTAFVVALVSSARSWLLLPLALALLRLVLAAIWSSDDPSPTEIMMDAAGLAGVAAMGGFIGWCVRHSQQVEPGGAARVDALDIRRLSLFVRQLDTSATLSSFGSLLTILGVGVALAKLGVFGFVVNAVHGQFSLDDVEMLALACITLPLFVMLPLGFIGIDVANRQDRLRPMSALTGAALWGCCLAVAGIFVAALYLVYSVPEWREILLNSPGDFDLRAALLPALTSLVVLFGIARGARLRAYLSSPIPRGLLYGAIPGGSVWPRLSFLVGLPASMWSRAATRRPAFWAFLASRPLVYVGIYWVAGGTVGWGVSFIVAGHTLFVLGKRLAARDIWRLGEDDAAPVLFLRSFEDDQFDFKGRSRNPLRRWIALWSFRRNLDEVLVDEVAAYGRVLALGRPGETAIPFGSGRFYSTHHDWQRVISETARRAYAIVIVAGSTPGVCWEYDMLSRENLLDRTLLLFRPGADAQAGNREALAAFPPQARPSDLDSTSQAIPLVALLQIAGRPVLLTAEDAQPAAYVLALRAHFQRCAADELVEAARLAPSSRVSQLRMW